MILVDPASGNAVKVSSGMSKEAVELAAIREGVSVEKLTADKWRVGKGTVLFRDGKLVGASPF